MTFKHSAKTPSVKEQLPLAYAWRDGLSFDNFCGVENVAVVQSLQHGADGGGDQFIYLWGMPGTGKSHLLQAACQRAAGRGRTVAYLPLADFVELPIEALDGLEDLSLVCLDDVQAVAGVAHWEEALFHLYNRLRDSGAILLAAGDASPAGLEISLPDLRSRLGWGPVFRVQEPQEDEKTHALQVRAKARGFDLPDEVACYLIRRSPRDMTSLFALLDRLDRASLAQQRRLTIPFVRNLI
ncbi:MAG: DnaA regulatory inactivator Hda [Gammaproteobacteria bacterium]|nr:DnaA regulatory inactivator Hda [Gammaproteobacteria bacterium]MCF6363268.1 DnaA regulatory inactivator Hda [Gammaproteobacteria bacterium]